MPAGFTLENYDSFGSSVAALGDLDGDGVVDIAVGAFSDDDGNSGAGAVYVVFLTSTGAAKSFQKLSASYGMPAGFTLDATDFFGSAVGK